MPFKCMYSGWGYINGGFTKFKPFLNQKAIFSEHEPTLGVYDFGGQNDVFSFLKLAQDTGFVVILRPGPYICGEHDYGRKSVCFLVLLIKELLNLLFHFN